MEAIRYAILRIKRILVIILLCLRGFFSDLLQFFFGILDTILFVHNLGVVSAHLTSPGNSTGGTLNPCNLSAQISSGNSSRAATVTGTNNYYFGLYYIRDLSRGSRSCEVLGIIPIFGQFVVYYRFGGLSFRGRSSSSSGGGSGSGVSATGAGTQYAHSSNAHSASSGAL